MTEVELLLNQQAELGDVTGNIAQIKQKIKQMESLDENSQVKLHFRVLTAFMGANSYVLVVLSSINAYCA